MRKTNYVVITPVRDEAAHIAKTLESVVSQTVLPSRWIIVDDGSTDGTGEILRKYAARVSWMDVVHKKNRGHRAPGGGVVEAFYAGYGLLKDHTWDFIVKLDGDLSFAPDYFEECFRLFAAQADLGIASGTICKMDGGKLKIDSVGDPIFHVRGASKIYRRACWEAIEPLVSAPGWDTIDEIKANLRGWSTRTFSDVPAIQNKPTGAADGRWRNWFKNGRANYLTGYHPLFMLAKCLKRVLREPRFVGPLGLLAGYSSGYLVGVPYAADREVVRFVRQQQIRRLLFRRSIYG